MHTASVHLSSDKTRRIGVPLRAGWLFTYDLPHRDIHRSLAARARACIGTAPRRDQRSQWTARVLCRRRTRDAAPNIFGVFVLATDHVLCEAVATPPAETCYPIRSLFFFCRHPIRSLGAPAVI